MDPYSCHMFECINPTGGGGGMNLSAFTISASGATVCSPEICTDGKDNDCDGKIDCYDSDCESQKCNITGGTCAVCVRTSLKVGKVCCGRKDTRGKVISSFINDSAGGCGGEWVVVNYDAYCYTGICVTNSPPYLDKDGNCSQNLPIKILGNPEYPAAFQRIYYLNKSGEAGVTGIDSCSEGFEAPYIDGGHCGHHPPPDVDRVETPKDDLECKITDGGETLSTNTDCYNLTLDTSLNDLPRGVLGIFECKDDGSIEGNCTGENIQTASTTKGFTICPCGEIDLGSYSFTIKSKHTIIAPGTMSFDISPIKIKIGPEEPCCGWPLMTANININGDEDWLDKVYKTVGPLVPIEGFKIEDFLPTFPPVPPYKRGTYNTGIFPNHEQGKDYNVDFTITLDCNNVTITSRWSYMWSTKKKSWWLPLPGWKWVKFKKKTGGHTKSYTIKSKANAISLLNGMRYTPGEDTKHYTRTRFNDIFEGDLFSSLHQCCPYDTTTVSALCTYIARGDLGFSDHGYYIGPSDAVFNPPARITYGYDIPDWANPMLYMLMDDYVEHDCEGEYTDSETVNATIGTAGGTISSLDGNFTLDIPSNALDDSVEFTVSKRTFDCSLQSYPSCSSDSECGSDYYENLHCLGENIHSTYHKFRCVHAGTVSSYCREDTYPSLEEFCTINETCENGQCAPVACINDSDGGVDIYEPGLIDGNGNYTDHCVNSSYIAELWCSGVIGYSISACPEICSMGRCTGSVTIQEVLDLIDLWVSGAATIDDVIIAVEDWINS